MNVRLNPGLVLLALAALIASIFGAIATVGYAAEEGSPGKVPLLNHLTPSPTLTLTPTPTPTPTPQPTSSSSQIFNLDEIYYFSPGGGGEFCGNWEGVRSNLPANARLPYVSAAKVLESLHIMCAYGFPPNREITFYLYAPNGKRVASYTIPATSRNDSQYGREKPIYLSYGLPSGTWTVIARGGSRTTARTTFTHPATRIASIDVTHVLTDQPSHPSDPRWRMPHKQGDRVAVYGVGFRRNSTITVAVAQPRSNASNRFRPVISWAVRTDSRGQFHLQFPIDRSFKDGNYRVLANPGAGRNLDSDDWISDSSDFFRVYTPWRACRSGPVSNLHKNDFARLSGGLPNNVRSQPRLNGRLLGKIQEYQFMQILAGPKCNNGYTWWYVELLDPGSNNGLKGWTAEGDRSGYWLMPIR